MKRLLRTSLAGLALLAALAPARAQLPPSGALIVNQTPIQGGSNGQCLFINSATVGAQACGGSGTVTSVSVTPANGVSGVVATSTTTPAITLTLGAITPTSVNGNTITAGTGTLTLGSVTLNAGAGGTLGSNAFTSIAYLPLTGGTLTGALLFSADNTVDLGASGATRPRTGYYGTSLVAPLHIGGTAASSTLTLQSTSGAGTTDAIIGQTGSQAERFRVTTAGLFNIGPNVAPDSLLTVNANTGATVAPVAGTQLHIIGSDVSLTAVTMDSFGARNFLFARETGGTASGKTAVGAATNILNVNAQPWDGSAYVTTSAIKMLTVNSQTTTDHSSQIVFSVTPTTPSAAIADVFFIQPSGGISVNTSTAGTAGSALVNGHLLASGTAPTVSSCGSSPSITGGDNFGSVTAGGGVLTTCVINFGQTWGASPRCVASSSTAIASLTVAASTTQLTIGGTSLTGDVISWICGATA